MYTSWTRVSDRIRNWRSESRISGRVASGCADGSRNLLSPCLPGQAKDFSRCPAALGGEPGANLYEAAAEPGSLHWFMKAHGPEQLVFFDFAFCPARMPLLRHGFEIPWQHSCNQPWLLLPRKTYSARVRADGISKCGVYACFALVLRLKQLASLRPDSGEESHNGTRHRSPCHRSE